MHVDGGDVRRGDIVKQRNEVKCQISVAQFFISGDRVSSYWLEDIGNVVRCVS